MPGLICCRKSPILKEVEQICKKKDPEYRQEQHQHAPSCCLQDPEEEAKDWLFKQLLAAKRSHEPRRCWGIANQLKATWTTGLRQSGGRLYSQFHPTLSRMPEFSLT